jgi:ABC-type Mn2+/Zn2+ transport system ATPase subunit
VLRSGHSQPREIAYLPQTTAHILDIKIKQLVDLAFRNTPKLPSVPFEVENFLENPSREVGDLSGGQQQMLLFWLVAFQPLHIFIYDEPLRHLDDHAAAFVTWTIEQQIHRGELVILSDHSDGSRWHVTNHCLDLTTCIYHR